MKLTLNGKKNGGNGNGNGGPGRWVRLALFALALLIVGILVFRQVDRMLGPKREVWVAARDLAAGAALTPEDLERAVRRASRLPENAVAAAADLAGRRLARDLSEGEPVSGGDIQRSVDTRQRQAASLAELLPAGRVLASVRVALQSVIMSELRFADRFSLLASDAGGAGVVAEDAYFLAWIDPALLAANGGNGGGRQAEGGGFLSSLLELPPGAGGTSGGGATSTTTMLLALYPQDVLPVSQAEAAGGPLSLVIHGQKEVEAGRMLSLRTAKVRNVELIEGADQETLQFRR